MPLLLRRALAQLRGQDQATWPERSDAPWPRHYPMPALLNHLDSEASAREEAARELSKMLERLARADDIGSAWAAVEKSGNNGSAVLLAMVWALRPVASMNAAKIETLIRDAKTAADRLASALTALRRSGVNVGAALTPPDAKTLRAYPKGARGYVSSALTDPANLLVTLRYIGGLPWIGLRAQRRGTVAKRRAVAIAGNLLAFGSGCASRLASAATDASITPRAVTKMRNQSTRRRRK